MIFPFNDTQSISSMSQIRYQAPSRALLVAIKALIKRERNNGITEEIHDKYLRIKSLTDCDDRLLMLRLQTSVAIIEKLRKNMFQLIRQYNGAAVYLTPENKLDTHLHMLLSISNLGKEQIFLFPKQHLLGEGISKKVWEGIDYLKETKIACGSITPEPSNFAKNVREFELQKSFGEALDCCFYLHDTSGYKFKMVMPLANWGSLEKATHPLGRLEFINALSKYQLESLYLKILNRVAEIHAAQIVLADIKPANILLHVENGEVSVRITDFGFAHKESEQGESLGGTPEFCAPELYDDSTPSFQTLASDVFALGRTLWELFLGGPPPWMIHNSLENYTQFWNAQKTFRPGTMEDLIYRMTDPSPEKRPSLATILAENPQFTFSSPFFRNTRLIRPQESEHRFRQNTDDFKNKYIDATPPPQAYTLIDEGMPYYIHLRTEKRNVPFKPAADGGIEVCSFWRTKKYASLEEYLEQEGLTTCLNYFT